MDFILSYLRACATVTTTHMSYRNPSQSRSRVDLNIRSTDPQEGLDHLTGHMDSGPNSAAPLLRMYTDKKD